MNINELMKILMKTTPDQAIYDFCNAIYKLSLNDFEKANEPPHKASFLFQCLIQMNELKMEAGKIVSKEHTISYILDDEKYTFWIVEVPEPIDKFAFLDYLTKELTAIFYNVNDSDCKS